MPLRGEGERGLQHDTLTRVFLMVTALATSVALAGFAVEVLIQLAWKYG